MNQPTLSILILSIETRAKLYARLMAILKPQITDAVEVLDHVDNGERPIGQKRNELMEASTGRYVCFVDDDDLITDDYVARILEAAKLEPDAIGFRLRRLVDKKYDADAIHSIRNDRWETITRDGKRVYLRTPNHLNPVRREIAIRHRFPETNHGEDKDYSERIRPEIRSEAFIDRVLYTYEYRTNQFRKGEKVNQSK